MSTDESLLRDLSLLLELALVPSEQESLERFSEAFIDRLLARTYASNALFFVRASLSRPAAASDDTPHPSLLGLAKDEPIPLAERFVPIPRNRAQYLVRQAEVEAASSGIERALERGVTRLAMGEESVLAKVAFAGVEPPVQVLQIPLGDVGVLELYGGAGGLIDEHLGRVLSTLAGWLAGQAKGFAARANDRQRFELAEASERWIARLFDELPGIIWRSDIHGRVTYTSRPASPLLGIEGGATWTELRRGIHPDDADRVEHAIADAVAARQTSLDLQYRLRLANGEVAEVSEKLILGFQPDGGLIHKAGFIDLSRVGAEELTPRSSLSRPRFMDRLSHELRSPLFPVIALSDLLLQLDPKSVSTEDWVRHLSMINQSGKALLELVTDLLELSRIEVRRTRVDLGPVDLPHLVRDLRSRFGAAGSATDFRVELEGEGGTLYVDRSTLGRVADALATSVSSLSAVRGARLVLLPGASSLTVRAIAHGVSPSTEVVDGWFEPFPTLARDPREHSVGDGLRMTLVKELAATLGGSSHAARAGEDLVLEVSLPARPPEPGRPPPLLGRVAVVAGRELQALVPVALDLIACGGEVRLAHDVATAEQLLRANGVDTLLVTAHLLGRRRLAAAARSPERTHPARVFLLDELGPAAPEGFEAIIRPSGGRAALLQALRSAELAAR